MRRSGAAGHRYVRRKLRGKPVEKLFRIPKLLRLQRSLCPSHGRGRRFNPYSAHHLTPAFCGLFHFKEHCSSHFETERSAVQSHRRHASMSALHPKADMCRITDVRYGPKADIDSGLRWILGGRFCLSLGTPSPVRPMGKKRH